jgi:hypothetical protein
MSCTGCGIKKVVNGVANIAKSVLFSDRVDSKERGRRLEICRGSSAVKQCSLYNSKLDECMDCWCIVGYKARFKDMKCGLEKWN